MTHRPSITSSPSFLARRLQAERWRLVLLAACVLTNAGSWGVRRLTGGAVALNDHVFFGSLTVAAVALCVLGWGYRDVGRRIRSGASLPHWPQVAAFAFDLCVPFALLLILQLWSPRGAYAALSAPVVLLVPIVIALSVLKLRPMQSLALGIAAALMHWTLAARAAWIDSLDVTLYPVIFTYGAYFLLCGAATAFLSYVVRQYIEEAIAEAGQAERANLQLATVENELQIARGIQLGLLPAGPPDFSGFDIAGRAEPASHAGGDYYDWQTLPDGRLVVAIADVTGHGIGPALVMAVCRAYARATVPTSDGAADFLQRLNSLVSGDVTGGRFITMAVALIGADGNVDLLSAGHGPSFMYTAKTGEVEHFGGDGLPLGIVAGESYAPIRRIRLERGDALVLITDGFMEQHSPSDEQFGIPRLHETIRRHAKGPSRGLIDALYAAVRGFAASTAQNDDMTVVVVRRT